MDLDENKSGILRGTLVQLEFKKTVALGGGVISAKAWEATICYTDWPCL